MLPRKVRKVDSCQILEGVEEIEESPREGDLGLLRKLEPSVVSENEAKPGLVKEHQHFELG